MFPLHFVFVTIVSMCLASLALADTSTDRVRAGISRYTDGKVAVASVTATPIPGIYEVVSGTGVFYADATGRYAFVDGRLVDTAKRLDLTQLTLQRISKIDFMKLPFEMAFKTVRGSGKRQLAIFEDPACSACRDLHASLSQLDDVTIYMFPMPIISEESAHAAVMALCAPAAQQSDKWNGYMELAEAIPNRVPDGCDSAKNKVERLVALSNQLDIHNTPTLVLGNGQRIVGRVPTDQLVAALDDSVGHALK